MEVEVNGIKYQKVERVPLSRNAGKLLMMATMFGGFPTTKSKPTPNVDLVEEYGLIQLKKSNLNRAQRDWVVYKFEKTFKPVTDKQVTEE